MQHLHTGASQLLASLFSPKYKKKPGRKYSEELGQRYSIDKQNPENKNHS